MKFSVSLLLSMVLGAHADLIQAIRQPKELAPRQFGAYSNNILHENPTFPDQSGQSNVKVNYNQNQIESRPQIYNNHFLNQQDFTQSYPTNSPQSQLFNVGYSVSFTNKPTKPVSKYTRTVPLDDGEIITGTRKFNEEVRGPNLNMSPQEYVSTALISNKKQKISGIKAKPHFISSFPNPKTLLTQANLSPVTQNYYKSLEQAKPQIQNVQELQQKYSWRNLSPGVEIIRSTEVPTVNQKFPRSEALQFDHAKALGRSQDFDYTNALDTNSVFYNQLKKAKIPSFSGVGQNAAKFPVDTSLLKQPVKIDTRLIDEAMRNQLALYSNNQFTQPQQTPQDVNYLQQTYRTIPVHEESQKEGIYPPEQSQKFADYQSNQNRFQYKVFGKSQPLIGGFNEPGEQILRQPRFLSDLNTHLRPPPYATIPYQRRVHVG